MVCWILRFFKGRMNALEIKSYVKYFDIRDAYQSSIPCHKDLSYYVDKKAFRINLICDFCCFQ